MSATHKTAFKIFPYGLYITSRTPKELLMFGSKC